MKRYLLALALLLVGGAGLNAQTVTVTGHMKSGNTSNVTSKAFMRFRLRNFSGNTPRVTSTGAIVQTQFDVSPDNTGTITTSLYGNDAISPVNTFWTVETWYNGVFQFSYNYGICASTQVTYCSTVGATFNLDSASPISFPTPPAPYLPLPGPAGPTGPQGPIGPQGPPGAGGTGPTLQTNNGTNASQSLLNLLNGSNVTMTNSGGGVTVNAVPATPAGCLQYDNAGAFGGASGICTPDGNNLNVKGPSPWADITSFGARAVTSAPSTTATCTATQTSVTLTAASTFQNGDGITLYGCGPTLTLTTPSAPSVTPSIAIEGTGLGGGTVTKSVVASGTGASTYAYEVIYRDAVGGLTAPSAATTIINGLSAIGAQTCTITTATRSNASVTVNLSSACAGAVAGARVQLTGQSISDFNGWYNISTVNSSTQIVINNTPIDSRSEGWLPTDSASSTGGTLTAYLSNHLNLTYQAGMWEAYVCAKRPGDGSFSLIGTTQPTSSTSGWRDLQFDDYGAPYNSNQTYPSYITNSNCNGGSAQNDPLTTTISSGAGTTSIVVANAASNNSSGLTAIFDDGPGIVAAANTILFSGGKGGRILIPTSSVSGGKYFINSYTSLPANIVVEQAGSITLNETLQINGVNWKCGLANSGPAQFATTGYAIIVTGNANPMIYSTGSNIFDHCALSMGHSNGGIVEVSDQVGVGEEYQHDSITVGNGTGNYLGMGLVFRMTDPGAESKFIFVDSLINNGLPSGTPLSNPLIYAPPGQNGTGGVQNTGGDFEFINTNFGVGGMEWEGCNGGPQIKFIGNRNVRQGGDVPLVAAGNCGGNTSLTAIFDGVTEDTDTQGLINLENTGGTFSASIRIEDASVGSIPSNGNGPNPPLTGALSSSSQVVSAEGVLAGRSPTTNGYGSCPNTGNGPFMFCMLEPELVNAPNGYIFSPLAAPTSPSGSTTAGGSITSETLQFSITAVDVNGKETIQSPLTSAITTDNTCPASGNCSVNLSWSGPTTSTGTVTYNIYECGQSSGCPTMRQTRSGVSGTSVTLTSIAAGASPPTVTQAGQTGLAPTMAWSPTVFSNLLNLTETTAPAGIVGTDQLYADSTAHAIKEIANNGSAYQLSGFTISPTNTDCVDWSGTGGLLGDVGGKCGHYTITPTNGDCVTWSGTGGLLGDAGAACGTPGGGMDTNMDNMANPTLMNHSLVPASANTIAVGTQALPFTNAFLGTVANQAGSFDTSALTANHVIKFPNADSTAVQNCASVSHEWISQILQSTGACTQTQPTLADVAAGASPAGLFNFSGSTMEIPQGAAFTAAANSTIGIDTTAKALHSWINAADSLVASFASAPAGSKCAQTTGTIGQLTEAAAACGTTTPSSSDTFTNKTYNAESTGNALSEPVRAYFGAGGCNNSTASNGFDIGVTNAPTPQCTGSTVRKGVLQFARGNVAYLNWHLPADWNSGASTDIEIGFTTTDTTNGHVTSFNVQTACNKVDGTVTDDPSLNASQALSVTTGASQTSGGELTGKLTSMTMTGCAADYNFEIVLTRNNSGVDTNSDTAVAVKFAEIVTGVTKNAANR